MKSMRRLFSVLLAVCVLALSSVAMAATDISNGVVRVTGIGAPGQPPYLGFIAARADAQRQLVAEVNGVQVADKVTVQLMATDPGLSPRRQIVKSSEKTGLFVAMDVGDAWLERALAHKI